MNLRSPIFLSIFVLALVGLPAFSPAQPPDAGKQAAAQSREVVLPVTVRNHKGELVAGVKSSDLTLTEDGRPQSIKSFTRETSLPFRLGLLVDTSRAVVGGLDAERKAAGKFVDTMLPEKPKTGSDALKDQAFLIHFDREVELLRDFTASRDKLHRELDEMGPTKAAQSNARASESDGESNSGQRHDQTHGRGGTTLYDAIFLASDELMKGQNGRKALIVFSDGVDRDSKETLNDAVDAADRAGVAVYTIYFKGEEERGQNNYPGQGGGRHGGGGQSEPGVDGKKIMEKIAQRTGGRFFEAKKKENLDEISGQIAEELRGQYLLTYTPDVADKEGGFHKIVLKSSNDSLTVVTREGYYAPGGDAK